MEYADSNTSMQIIEVFEMMPDIMFVMVLLAICIPVFIIMRRLLLGSLGPIEYDEDEDEQEYDSVTIVKEHHRQPGKTTITRGWLGSRQRRKNI